MMIGYDTHGPQQPPSWDKVEQTFFHDEVEQDGYKFHGQCDFKPCSGVLEEYTVQLKHGWPVHVFFICRNCGKEFKGNDVLEMYSRDSSDLEYDYV